jgi:hypothetical protein
MKKKLPKPPQFQEESNKSKEDAAKEIRRYETLDTRAPLSVQF